MDRGTKIRGRIYKRGGLVKTEKQKNKIKIEIEFY